MSDEEENPLDRDFVFHLSRVAHGERNVLDSDIEVMMQAEAKERREVLLPYVDIATAWALTRGANDKAKTKIARAVAVSGRPSSSVAYLETGWAVYLHETCVDLHHLVRYFDLIEKNEAPDTPLLEWLVACRVVAPAIARYCAKKFRNGDEFPIPLADEDAERLLMAAEVAVEIQKNEDAKKAAG